MHHVDVQRLLMSICSDMELGREALYGLAEICDRRDFNPTTAAGVMKWAARDFDDMGNRLRAAMELIKAMQPQPEPEAESPEF